MHLKTFGINSRVGYKEVNINSGAINKFYEINNQGCEKIVTIPDGCIDIEFLYQDGKIYAMLCGSHVEGMFSEIGNYDYCFGIKFNPGVFPATINASIANLVNARLDLKNYLHIYHVENQLFESSSFEKKVDFFTNIFSVGNEQKAEIDITSYVIEQVEKHCGAVNIAQLVDDIGYSQCYINRVFKDNIGMSIKKYADIMRMQESIQMLHKNADREMEEIYDKLGYYDQAHFIKSFKKFTTFTPKKYLENQGNIMFV